MSSLAEQIAATLAAALTGTIAAVGTRVYRAREDAIDSSECPAIVVRLVGESTQAAEIDAGLEQNQLALQVAIHADAGEASNYETVTDALVAAAHPLIRAAAYPGDTGPPQRTGRRWQGTSGDGGPGVCVVDYEFIYFNATTDLSDPG